MTLPNGVKQWAVGIIAAAAIAASLFFLFHKPAEKAEVLATNVSEALGLRAADEVAALIGHKGQVAVLEMDLKAGQAPTAVSTMATFRQRLKKAGITVARTKALPGGLTALIMGGGIPQSDFVGLVEAAPPVDAVVSFAGLPNWPGDGLSKYQASHPPLVVVDIFGSCKGPALPAMVDEKTVALAFAPLAATEVEQQGNETRMFERYYRILRPPVK